MPPVIPYTTEYQVISDFYGYQTAARSKVPLMKHINEGLLLLDRLGATDQAKAAFCLHPIVQNNENVDVSWSPAYQLACEYRDRANSYLCRPETDHITTKEQMWDTVGDMSDACRLMLLADKLQNYSDFLLYHHATHARSQQLHRYFRLWIDYLTV